MSISVSVPLDALSNPKVARALSDLMLSLAGLEASARRAASAGRDKQAAGDSGAPTRTRSSRSRRAKAPFGEGLSEEQRFQAFVEGLPKPSRDFLDLIQSNGRVTLSKAVKELGITVPKAIGGITGSLSRWARDRGVELPFRADKNASGERVWIWTRGDDTASGAKGQSEGKTGRRSSRSRRRSGAKQEQEASEDNSGTRGGTGPPGNGDGGVDALLDGQSDTAREFLTLLSDRGELTMSEALKSFGLKHAQAIGAVIRSFRKRAKERDLTIPFEESRSRTGERMWTWTGVPEDDEDDKDEGRRTGAVLRRRGGRTAPAVPV